MNDDDDDDDEDEEKGCRICNPGGNNDTTTDALVDNFTHTYRSILQLLFPQNITKRSKR